MVMLGEEVGRGRWGSEVRGGMEGIICFSPNLSKFSWGTCVCVVVLCCVVLCVCVCVMGGIR